MTLPTTSPAPSTSDATQAVVFLHSLGGTSQDWQQELASAASGRRVLAVDLPGFGAAPVLPSATIADMAAEVLETCDAHRISQAVFVGLSMGGMVALQIAATAPARVAGLVLCSTTAKVDDGIQTILGSCEQAITAAGMAAFADGMIPQIFSAALLAAPTAAAAHYIDTLRASDPAGFIAAAGAIATHDVEAALPGITCPTRVIHGDADTLIAHTHGRRIAALIPHAELTIYEGCRHMTPLEEPARFQRDLAEFLAATFAPA